MGSNPTTPTTDPRSSTTLDAPRSSLEPWLPLLAVSAVLGAISWLAYASWRDPDVPYLSEREPAQWIVYPTPFRVGVRPAIEMGAAFRRRFTLDAAPAEARLSVRAFRRVQVRVNGRSVAFAEAANWKQERHADVAALLRPGENEIVASVLNDYGPPALWLALVHSDGRVVSDAEWEGSLAGASWRTAVVASDPARRRIDDPFRITPTLADSLKRTGAAVALCALLAAGMLAAFRVRRFIPGFRDGARAGSRLNAVLLLAVAALWIALVVHNSWWQRRTAGFDAEGHLDYVERLQTQGGIPLADEGAEMFQPPLYYWLAAGALGATGRTVGDPGDIAVVRAINLLLVLIGLLLVRKSLRLIFPAHPQRVALGFLVAAMLPMQLTLHHHPTNEILAGTLGSALLYAALRVLQDEAAGAWRHAVLGAVMGLALLAKSSLLVLAAAVGLALLTRALLDTRGGRRRRGAVRLVLTLVVCLAVSGWYYAVVWAHFGKPLVASFDPITGYRWWQDPSYRMAADYLRFGRSFSSPVYSAATSLWDGFYSTMWGDGACSGASLAVFCPPWSFERMTLGYWLAIVPMLGIAAGALAMLIAFAREPMRWLLFVAAIGGTLLAMLVLVTTVPQYSLAKSFYGLMALVPLAAMAGWGLDLLAGAQRWRRAIVWLGVLTWALNAYATFWVQDRPATRAAIGTAWVAEGDERGLAELRAALARDPRQPLARLALAETLLAEPGRVLDAQRLAALTPNQLDSAPRQVFLAKLYAQAQEAIRAEAAVREAIRLDPDYLPARRRNAALEMRRGPTAGIEAYREVLRLDPFDAEAHGRLAELYGWVGLAEGAAVHQHYVNQLTQPKPGAPGP